MEKPSVSICCITYNHVNYIGECIEGFLLQKTSFPIEILIFDDASTDGTKEIIENYAKQDNRIKTFFQNENQWSKEKYGLIDWLLPAAQSKYTAICEGDDYWTDPLKLQKQVDFLESNHSAVAVCTNAKLLSLTDDKIDFFSLEGEFVYEIELNEIYRNNVFPTLTGLYRTEIIKKNNFQKGVVLGDWYLIINAMQFGKAYRLNFVSAHYRIHENGVFSTRNEKYRLLAHIRTAFIILKNNNLKNKDVLFRENKLRIIELIRLDAYNRQYLDLIVDSFLLVKNKWLKLKI